MGRTKQIWEYQAPATLNQAGPVQNTWYTILDTTVNARIYRIGVNVEDADEDLEVQAIVDGETIAASAETCTHSTTYTAYLSLNAISRADIIKLSSGAPTDSDSAFAIEGKSVKIQVRKTSANGAGNLTGIVVYGVAVY